jgi:hypothetical protein
MLELRLQVREPEAAPLPAWFYDIGGGHWWKQPAADKAKRLVQMWVGGVECWTRNDGGIN